MALARSFSALPRLLWRSAAVSSVRPARNYAEEAIERNLDEMLLTFASPGDMFYHDKVVKQVDVPGLGTNMGILAKHVPTLAVLKPGVVTVYEEDGTQKKFFVSSGSVSINADSTVQLLAEEACPMDNLDIQAAREGADKARSELNEAGTDQAKAEAQIAVDFHEELVKALEGGSK